MTSLERLTAICAGCGKVLYQGPQPAYKMVSHGICLPCQTKVMHLDGDTREELTEFVNLMTAAGF